MYLYFQHEEEESEVEGKRLVIKCTILRSTGTKERGRMENFLETIFYTVSWNQRKYFLRILWGFD